jgi:hypothetical protein
VGDAFEAFGAEHLEAQRAVCARFGVPFVPTPPELKVGINLKGEAYPLNGYREPENPAYDELSGWWIWNGERELAGHHSDFWDALHVSHLPQDCPEVVAYLGLPRGWHFLVAPGYEDAWFDPKTRRPSD